jgi:glycosyltransferase involved in cell wall biosynthesis
VNTGSRASPLVSVAVPVYNGERYLAEALESILAQTVADLEIIVTDNASNDGTAAICQRYASKDARVRYVRNPSNIGANPNFNLGPVYARGKYFKWTAHDDVLEPSFLEKCIAALESNTDAVLCHTHIRYIDSESRPIGIYEGNVRKTTSSKPHERFGGVILPAHPQHEVLGLYNREALENSVLFPSYHNGPRELLAENSLRGKIVIIPEPLQCIRDHVERYSHANTEMVNKDRAAFLDPAKIGELSFPWWRLYREYWKLVRSNVYSRYERMLCYGQLVRWFWWDWHSVRLAVDLIRIVSPEFGVFAERLKQKYISPEPGMGEVRARRG